MAYSLETRAPFLNQELSHFATNHAIEYNFKKGINKYFLKNLLQDFFPVEFFDRPKQGFGVPLYRWLIGPLNTWMHDLICEGREFLPPNEQEKISSMVTALERGNELLAPRIWTYLLYLDWMLRNDDE